MKPILLFGTQFTLSLVAYALLGLWYAVPRLSGLSRQAALQPLVWVHAFRMIGGTILAPGAVGAGVPLLFQREIGYGDMITAFLALAALVALRTRSSWAIPLVWLVVLVGLLDTINAIIQSLRYNVFVHALGVNWVIVTAYVPALLVSSALIFWQLTRSRSARPARPCWPASTDAARSAPIVADDRDKHDGPFGKKENELSRTGRGTTAWTCV